MNVGSLQPGQPNTGSSAPGVVTGSPGYGAILNAMIPGLSTPQTQQAASAALQKLAKKMQNKVYIRDSIPKLACALTNGLATQAFANATPFTFTLPQPNNAYATGIRIRTTVNYTLAVGTAATYALTAAGILALYDNIEIRYNKSQIKFRPLWLRELARMGAIHWKSVPSVGSTDGGSFDDSTYLDAYTSPAMPTATGAQSAQFDLFIPFNVINAEEDRGLLPTMAGETGIQVVCTTAASIFGPDPVYNAIYTTGGTGAGVSAVSGTIKVMLEYRDGENYLTPTALPYNLDVLDGTIQIQTDAPLTTIVAGAATVNRRSVTVLGKHAYVGLLIVDGNQSQNYSLNSNIIYLDANKDGVGANKFWAYGTATNLDVQQFFLEARRRHKNSDLSEGIVFVVEGPIQGQNALGWSGGSNDGMCYLDNTTSGWPAFTWGVSLTSINALGAGTARIEPLCIFINPVGLPVI